MKTAKSTARAKGNAFQRWCARYLEARGWSVYNQTPVTRVLFIGGKRVFAPMHKDIFGADLVAVKENSKVLFVQSSLDSHVEKREAEFKKYHFPTATASVQLWIKRESGDVAVFVLNEENNLENLAYIRKGKYVVLNELRQFDHPDFRSLLEAACVANPAPMR
jgi:hypothetical protein